MKNKAKKILLNILQKERHLTLLSLFLQLYYQHVSILLKLTIDLYQGVLNMTLTPFNLVVYALVSVFAAYFLSISYQNNFFKVRARIAVRFEKTLDETNTKLSTNQREFVKNEKGRLTDLASSGQALALSNLIYILSVLAFTFYFFKNVVPVANYALSCSLASGLAYLLSTSSAKKKDKKKK